VKNRPSIFLTGASGFVGKNLLNYFSSRFSFVLFNKKDFNISYCDIVIHLAGKAHDVKNVLDASEYYLSNTYLTKQIFQEFLNSPATVFITLSSVKAVADYVDYELTEDSFMNPLTHYGKSKKLAEEFILSNTIPKGKRVYILRPCMIHGVGNKGNLNLLYKFCSLNLPWPLGSFLNQRSFCSLDNLLFVIDELISRSDIPSGVYNVSDDNPLSTNQIVSTIFQSLDKTPIVWKIPKKIIIFLAKISDFFSLPFNSDVLIKLTQNFIVSNRKIKDVIGKELPIDSLSGLKKTLNSFK
jgi:nucleoside-diphosphate-sugar epimerase